jgi:deoxyribose-phosphate aldolase
MHNKDWISKVDYTLLEDCTEKDIIELCEKATEFNVKSVCVFPQWVKICAEILRESSVLVCTVIDFPFGKNTLEAKIKESNQAILKGADELDLVMNYDAIKNPDNYFNTLNLWSEYCHQFKDKTNQSICLKVIVESGLLSLEETKLATEMCISSNVDYIKTSTGKVGVGAEIEKVQAMKEVIVNNNVELKIKASGGIRTIDQIQQFDLFVDRFGMGFKSVDELIKNA